MTIRYLQSSSIPTYQKLNAFMESAKPSVYAKSNSEGLDRVRKEDGMYAFFMEAAAIEYHIERFCDLRQLGGLLDSKGYGIALPKGNTYLCLKFFKLQYFKNSWITSINFTKATTDKLHLSQRQRCSQVKFE